jgi:hypothetical protein
VKGGKTGLRGNSINVQLLLQIFLYKFDGTLYSFEIVHFHPSGFVS